MESVRSFVAIFPPPEIQKSIFNIPSKFEINTKKTRWVEEQYIHLTLKFLGNQTFESLSILNDFISNKIKNLPQIKFSISSLGFFNRKYGSVIFANSQIENQNLVFSLLDIIENSCTQSNISVKPEHNFHPHFTLARLHRNIKSDLQLKLQTTTFEPINFLAENIYIMKSVLTSQKPIYTKLYSINFQKEK